MRAPLLQHFQQFVANPASDELAAALLVNKVLDTTVDVASVRADIELLADACPDNVEPWSYLREQGFTGNSSDYDASANSCLDVVLRTRTGIPISLGVLLVHVARRCGHDASGINFPGHFLARIDNVLVDPFAFQTVTEAQCIEGMSARQPDGDLFATATSGMIAMRMMNNLKVQWVGEARWDEALNLLDYQIVIAPNEVQLYFERGEAWERLGAPDLAKAAYADAERIARNPRVESATRKKIEGLDADPTVWN